MKFLVLFILFVGCNSQQNNSKVTNLEVTPQNTVQENYFLGKWTFSEKKYDSKEGKKNFPLHECMKKYTLNFEKDGSNLILIKSYATGKDCSITSSSGKYILSFDHQFIKYEEGDLKTIFEYKIYNETKFSLIYKEILNGSFTTIEDIYIKQ